MLSFILIISIMDVRFSKYKNFDPKVSKWGHDVRDFETATKSLDLLVSKNYSSLALPCVALYPMIDLKTGRYRGFKVAAPDGPLKDFFEKDENRQIFFDLMREATIDAMAKKNRKEKGNNVDAAVTVARTTAVSKPPRPIWTLTLKECETYFSTLKTQIAEDEGVKLRPKWPKLVNNVAVKLPPKLASFDAVIEQIIPSSMYVPFQKFSLGNLHWRLKLACAY